MKYVLAARQMKDYEDELYDEWLEHVENVLPGLLKRNLLTVPPPPTTPGGRKPLLDAGILACVSWTPAFSDSFCRSSLEYR